MFDNQTFQKLVEADNLTGEVVGVNSFIVEVKGLEGVRLGSQILFEDGQRGVVREAYGDKVILFNIDSEKMSPGTLAVVENDLLSVPVGKNLIGRVITPMGKPIDGKGALRSTETSGIFNPAPGIMARSMLNEQLASGVTAVDMFFPVVLGQRIAILGDSKSGKSTFLGQLSANQDGTDRIVVYVLIGKRKVDIERLLSSLRESGAMDHTIVVLADIFDSLTQSYLAPYAACAMAEHLWYSGKDVIIIYDDLSSHAEAYRQLSLLQEVDPGRDSYPGDMFYAHSSLLERAGKLLDGNKTLTALPVVMTPNDDVTAYLSTSIMSITDGQIIFDLGLFRTGIRPAVNAGLSVSRVGGQAQTGRQKRLSGSLFKMIAKYKQAEEFSHFGSNLSKDAQIDLTLGKQIYEVLGQPPEERHSLTTQQLMLETVILGGGETDIDIPGLKESAKKMSDEVKEEKDFDECEAKLLKKHAVHTKDAVDAAPVEDKPADGQRKKPMRRASAIEKESIQITTVEDLTGVFESIASTQVAKVKNKVEVSKEFFRLLWSRYSTIRVDPSTQITNRELTDGQTKKAFIIISAEAGLSGDIDQRLIETMLRDYDKNTDIIVLGTHGATQLNQRGIPFTRYFQVPETDRYINVGPVIEAVAGYSKIVVFYEEYVSLGVQDIKTIDLISSMRSMSKDADPEEDIMTSQDTIFEPSLDDIADQMEETMMTLALSQTILESSLAQAASRFNAMAVAKKKRAGELLADYRLEFHRAKRGESDRRLREVMVSLKKKRKHIKGRQ